MKTHQFGDKSSTGTALAISPDESILVTAGFDYQLHFWSLPDGKSIGSRDGHKGMVKSLAFSADGKRLASGDAEGEIRVWAIPSMALELTWRKHAAAVIRLNPSSDGALLAAGDYDGHVVVWRVKDADDVIHIPGRGSRAYVSDLVLSRDGRLGVMACANDHRVYCWSAGSDQLHRWEAKGATINDLQLDEAGTLAATLSGGYVQLWAIPGGRQLFETKTRDWSGSATAALTPDGKLLVVGDTRGIKMWTIPGSTETVLDEHEMKDYTGRFVLGDQGRVLAGVTLIDGQRALRLWSLPNRQILADVKDMSKAPTRVLRGGNVLLRSEDTMPEGGDKGLTLVYLG
jgi:WD40 repeat protein